MCAPGRPAGPRGPGRDPVRPRRRLFDLAEQGEQRAVLARATGEHDADRQRRGVRRLLGPVQRQARRGDAGHVVDGGEWREEQLAAVALGGVVGLGEPLRRLRRERERRRQPHVVLVHRCDDLTCGGLEELDRVRQLHCRRLLPAGQPVAGVCPKQWDGLLRHGRRGHAARPHDVELRLELRRERVVDVDDVVAERLQQPTCLLPCGDRRRGRLDARQVWGRPAGDAETPRLAGRPRRERDVRIGKRTKVAGHRMGHRVEQRCGVPDGAGQRPVPGKAGPVAAEGSDADPAAARLEPDDAAAARRDADGSAPVAPLGQRDQPSSHRGRRAAARATGVAGQVPWRPGRADEVVVRVGGQPELGCVRLAEADEAGLLHERDDVGVDRRDVVLHHHRAHRRADAGRRGEVLERHRDAEKRCGVTVRHPPVRVDRALESLLRGDGDERAERLGVIVDAVQVMLDELHRRRLASTQQRRLGRGVEVVQLGHGPSLGRSWAMAG